MTLPSTLSTVSVTAGTILTSSGKTVSTGVKASGTDWRFIIFGLNQNSINAGTLLTAQLTIASGAFGGTLSLRVTNVSYSDPNGNTISGGASIGGSITIASSSSVTTPWRTLSSNIVGSEAYDYNMGYRFTPNANGQITQLAIRTQDSISHAVRLYDMNGNILASANVTGSPGQWVVGNITPINVTSGVSYVVAVRIGGGGAYSYETVAGYPETTGHVTVNESRYILASDALPNTIGPGLMYGEADITFVPGSPTGSPPVITQQPQNATVTAGQTTTFTVIATGAATYQWQSEAPGATSFSTMSGATSSSYSTPVTSASYSGFQLQCVVTGAGGSVTSSVATLTVNPLVAAPVISTFTASPASISQGGSSTLSWTTSGAASLSISPTVGVVTGQVSAAVSPSQTTTYILTSTNSAGSVTAAATVTVGQSSGVTTPWRTLSSNSVGSEPYDYNMGYRFTPNANGQITQLAIRTQDSISHTVRLYDMNGNILASANVTGSPGQWVVGSITPINVTSGVSYVVAVRIGSGGAYSYETVASYPETTGNVTVNESRYVSTSDAFPNTMGLGLMYGEADITFVPLP